MQQARYRVETFIIPEGNQCHKPNTTNEEDDMKIANKLKRRDERVEILNGEVFKNIDVKEEHISSITQLKECCATLEKDSEGICTLNNIIASQMQMRRFNSLTSIDEKLEDIDDQYNNLCYHGYKNGCTVPAPSPEEISEEIFKENWVNRLEILRNREAALNDKEITLQCRERSLFQKEKELRILERQLKDKVKQMEQHSKKTQRSQSMNNEDCERASESRSSSESSGSHSRSTVCSAISKSSTESNGSSSRRTVYPTDAKSSTELKTSEKIAPKSCEYIQPESPHHNNTQENCSEGEKDSHQEAERNEQTFLINNVPTRQIASKSFARATLTHRPSSTSVSNISKFQSSSYFRSRQRSKISYDDLDSTLSADIGDASFVQTSKKFNPADYKKPFAFTRSASERKPRYASNKDSLITAAQSINTLKEKPLTLGSIEENKILRRVSDNISASNDGCTTFQDYGLIDQQLANSEGQCKSNVSCNEKRYSYLNLESEQHFMHHKKAKALKERPVSWSAETNEWLQKKREAYNLTTKRIVTEDFENKENVKCSVKRDEIDKSSKKRDVKRKMFTIFR